MAMVMCIRVPKEKGEKIKEHLISSGLLNRDARIRAEGNDILIPVRGPFEGYDLSDENLELTDKKETDYRNVADVPDEVRGILPNSYDVIGDIAVLRFHEESMPYEKKAGEALLRTSSSIRAVMADRGVKGEMRIRDIVMIAGTGTSETVHREFGVTMAVDPAKIYFNPRLSTERMRIASLVRDGETVTDMFAGAAPFPLVISKHSRALTIYSIDINGDAVEYMKKNIKMNKTVNIIPICGDARTVIKGLPPADRMIMNLPHSADMFLDDALSNLKKGGTVHMYKISERESSEDMVRGLISETGKKGHSIRIERKAELKTYSPTMSVYALDIVKE